MFWFLPKRGKLRSRLIRQSLQNSKDSSSLYQIAHPDYRAENITYTCKSRIHTTDKSLFLPAIFDKYEVTAGRIKSKPTNRTNVVSSMEKYELTYVINNTSIVEIAKL